MRLFRICPPFRLVIWRFAQALILGWVVMWANNLVAQDATGHRLLANQGAQLFIFDAQGQVEWTMRLAGAPHDLHWLPNGNILTHQKTEIIEVDPRKSKIVWKFDAARLTKADRIEIHSVAPLKGNLIMVAISGARQIVEIDRRGIAQHTIPLKVDHPNAHRDTRLVRPLENGHYLVAHEGDGAVREYDRDGSVVWEYAVPLFGKELRKGHGPESFGNAVFSAIRLTNGNTLIGTGNGHSVLEVTPDKKVVWKVEQNDLNEVTLAWVTTLEVHADGSIVIGNCHAGKENPQLVKINRDKKVLWSFKNFEQLGNSVSNSQILDAQGTVVR